MIEALLILAAFAGDCEPRANWGPIIFVAPFFAMALWCFWKAVKD